MISPKKRLLSGIKPTGRIHIGNYFGALRQLIELQDKYEVFIFIPDLHALTENKLSKEELALNTRNVILDYLGAGLNPDNIFLFKQSDILEHTNLAWIFNCLITVPYLQRAHSYKDAEAKGKEISVGTFAYPVLMAADILLYDADIVPVGQDQKQHIEYARDIAEKFNFRFGELFKLPEPLILDSVATIPGIDGRKMSKSYSNTIPLFATDEEITKAVMNIATDSRGKDEVKDPNELTLYQIHRLFNNSAELKAKYTQGLGYGDAKKMLITDIMNFVTPLRQRRQTYEQSPKLVKDMLLRGKARVAIKASEKLRKVYRAVGLSE